MVAPSTLTRGAALALTLMAAGCGIEGELFGPALDGGLQVLPEPRDTLLYGQVSTAPGAAVLFYGASGQSVADAAAVVDDDGVFLQHFPGALAVRALVVWATQGDRSLVALLPDLPAQPTVFHTEHELVLWDAHEAMIDVGVLSTTVTLVALQAARRALVGLDAFEEGEILATIDQIWDLLEDEHEALVTVGQLVATLDTAAGSAATGQGWLDPVGLTGVGSMLSSDWLAAASVDYDGDGAVDSTTAAFDAAVDAAAALIDVGVCYPTNTIRVVFHLDLRPGAMNQNCGEVNHFKWASDSSDKSAFFTGGVHVDNPVCGPEREDHCLTEAEIDAVNVLTGGWVPNVVPMFDDGSPGDAVAGDGVWALVLDLPYIPTASSPDGAGVRIGYKYTFGLPGQGWTDSEEWPGNQRLLELEDVNGDHLVVRYDVFGDETANKDKVNGLSPAAGGCGSIDWEADRDPDCAGDSRENQVDTDGDCVADAWETAGGVVPITESCPEQ